MTTDLALMAARMNVREWLHVERRDYADRKFSEESEARDRLKRDTRDYPATFHPRGDERVGEWEGYVFNYLSRVRLFGVDTPLGRQALGKLIVTLTHCLETAVQEHGPMPVPGVSSGEIEMRER